MRFRLILGALLALATSPALAQDEPVDPHAGVPGVGPVGTDPHAGVPGVGPGPAGDPHAGVPGVGPVVPGADPHAGVPGVGPAGDPHAAGDPHGGGAPGPHGGMDLGALFQPPNVAFAESSPDVPAGSVRVEVEDEHGAPVNAAEVELGTMSGGSARERQAATTGPDGVTTYADLEAGSGHAYRVYVMYEGARYASEPFVLMPEQGHRVRIRRLPVSHDDRQVLQFVAQTIVEIREDRLHCVYQAQLVNVGQDTTYVFPPGGMQMHLPEGFLAFNAQAALNEIEITEVEDHGVAFSGSLPPGLVTIAFSFDVPYSPGLGLESIGLGSGNDVTLNLGNPFRTMRYRIIVDAPEGLVLDAEGMPRPQRFESDGHTLLGTELMRRPGDPPLEEVVFTLRGLPGPGPTRWIATFLGLLLMGAGAYFASRDRDGSAARATMLAALERRQEELIAEAEALRKERDAGEIGPETCQSRLDAIVQELASVLSRKDKLSAGRSPAVGAGRSVKDAPAEPKKNRRKAPKPATSASKPSPREDEA